MTDPRDAPTPRPRVKHEVTALLKRAQEESDIHRQPTDPAPPLVPEPGDAEPELAPAARHDTSEPVNVVDALTRLTSESDQRNAARLDAHEKFEQEQLDAKLNALHDRLALTNLQNLQAEAEKLARPFSQALAHFESWRKGEGARITKLEERVAQLESQLKSELASVRRELAEARGERTLHEGGEDVG